MGDLDERGVAADQLRPASRLRSAVEGWWYGEGRRLSAFARPALHDSYTHVGWNYASMICCSSMNVNKIVADRAYCRYITLSWASDERML